MLEWVPRIASFDEATLALAWLSREAARPGCCAGPYLRSFYDFLMLNADYVGVSPVHI